ncbi:hypothetical protein [Pseudaminobacter soli (ex Li et al. 2025)]|nr:hypothetical protein [Mesorhizobium soli]
MNTPNSSVYRPIHILGGGKTGRLVVEGLTSRNTVVIRIRGDGK